jgi:hypothetical protein
MVSIQNVLVPQECTATVLRAMHIALHTLVQCPIRFITEVNVFARVLERKEFFKIRVSCVAPSMRKSLEEIVSALKILS